MSFSRKPVLPVVELFPSQDKAPDQPVRLSQRVRAIEKSKTSTSPLEDLRSPAVAPSQRLLFTNKDSDSVPGTSGLTMQRTRKPRSSFLAPTEASRRRKTDIHPAVSIPTDTITYRKRKTKVILIPNDAADKENSPGSMQSNSKTSGGKDEDAVKKVVVIEPSLEKSPESGDSSSSDDRSEKADEELVRLQQSLDELSLKIATKEAEVENYREMLAKSEVQSQENRFQHEQDRAGSLAASIENYEVRIEEYSKLVDRNCDEKEKWKSQYLVLVQDSERIKQMTQTLKLENDNLKKQNANLMSLLAVSHQRRNEAEACEYLKSSSRFLTAQDNPEYILGFSEALESVFCETLSSSIADSLLWFRTSILHLLGKAGE